MAEVLRLVRVEPWGTHPAAMPVAEAVGAELSLAANGTGTCAGGWQLVFGGTEPGRRYRFEVTVRSEGLDHPRDILRASLVWCEAAPDDCRVGAVIDDALRPVKVRPEGLRLSADVTAPPAAEAVTLRYVFRWSPVGRSWWSSPEITALPPAAPRPPVRVAVVTGVMAERRGIETIADNTRFYLAGCEAAAACDVDLIVLPEIALQWGLKSHPIDHAVAVPGPETAPFQELAQRAATRICLGLHERRGDAVHNSAVLISPDGEVDGVYRKVHLAAGGEDVSGVLPGDTFDVFATELGRIGCNICMDSSATESSRMVGLNGADFLLLPIMGDHRSDRHTPGPPIFNESRWLAIQRTHAIDNQICLVIARNTTQGSCVIDRKGDVLAWNEGDQPFIVGEVNLDDGYRCWNGGCFREVNWLQRRPHLYAPFSDESNLGSL